MDQSNINHMLQTVENQSQKIEALEEKVKILENFINCLGARHDKAISRLAREVCENASRYQNSIQGLRNELFNLEARERLL